MSLTMLVRGGVVHDGSGRGGAQGPVDVGIEGDRVVLVGGTLPEAPDALEVDATGLTVVPGFVNVLSHAWASLQLDGSGASDLVQGVTTEVFGEAYSLGPGGAPVAGGLTELVDVRPGSRVDFARLGDGLDHLESLGVAPNVASFVGGDNLRILGAGFADRPLADAELDRVRGVLCEEMQDGALGLGTALIYPPGGYAGTEELVALAGCVGEYDGTYVSHLRSEGERFLESLEELLEIGRRGGCRAEVYHLKAAGRDHWPKMAQAIDRIQAARDVGAPVGANMYPYTAGGTALGACIPPRFHDGGAAALATRLTDPAERREMAAAIRVPSGEFENLYLAAGGGAGVRLDTDLPDGTSAQGRTLAEVAAGLGLDEVDALLEIVARAPTTGAAYVVVDETNLELGLAQPWVSIGSDAEAHDAVAPFTGEAAHPRTYGTFARVLGHYVRDRGVADFDDVVRRMTSLPAEALGLTDRGRIRPGAFADLVVLDPAAIADPATFEAPHQLARGVVHVVVNGVPVVRDGRLLAARPGRRLRRGPTHHS